MEGWIGRFTKEFLKRSGEHLIEVGITGSGKTQGLYWILEGLIHHSKDTIVWFDSGKSSEILTLSTMKELNLLIPEGLDVEIESEREIDVSKTYIGDLNEIWMRLDENRINVITIWSFILDPVIFTEVVAKIFTSLIRYAHEYRIKTPLTIFYDEFHTVAPARGHGLSEKHYRYGSVVQLNIERLRSLKIRFVATTQGWTKIKKGVRDCFNWIICRRGASFSSDQPKLQRFNPLFEKLKTDECIIVYPTKLFSDIIKLPRYDDGESLGRVRYKGVFEHSLLEEESLNGVKSRG
jgi:hypothetical protein